MKHYASGKFQRLLRSLPKPVQELAGKNLELLKANHNHPSLHFKRIGKFRSIRIGLAHRALAVEIPEGLLWFWIGNHSEYDKMVS